MYWSYISHVSTPFSDQSLKSSPLEIKNKKSRFSKTQRKSNGAHELTEPSKNSLHLQLRLFPYYRRGRGVRQEEKIANMYSNNLAAQSVRLLVILSLSTALSLPLLSPLPLPFASASPSASCCASSAADIFDRASIFCAAVVIIASMAACIATFHNSTLIAYGFTC